MNTLRRFAVPGVFCIAILTACGSKESATSGEGKNGGPQAEEKVLNLYNWNDYLGDDTIANFEKATGIKVSLSNYGSNEELDGKLAAGNSGYDIVVPTASYYERQIRFGYYQKLDKSKLPNLANMDPDIQQRLALHDPGNQYAVLHMWGTTGIGYNVKKVKAVAPDAPLDSWQMVFDPKYAKKLASCGIATLDSASDMFNIALNSIHKDPNSQNAADINAAAEALMKVRPYIRFIDTQRIIGDLANGEICVAVGYNGDMLQGRNRAIENNTGQEIAYFVPKEGSIIWFDSYLIPKDAPHPGNAHAFINYMLQPEVIGAVSSKIKYANGNAQAGPYVDKAVLDDPGIYPPADVKARLVPDLADTEETTRLMTRLWTKFMTGH